MIRKNPPLRIPSLVSMILFIFAGCAQEEIRPAERERFSLDELAIDIRGAERDFLFSDRAGGFLHGTTGGARPTRFSWWVGGKEIASGVRITIQGQPIDTVTTVSCLVTPDRFTAHGTAGWGVQIAPLDAVGGVGHALGIRFLGLQGRSAEVTILPPKNGGRGWQFRLVAGPGGRVAGGTVSVDGEDSLDVVLFGGTPDGPDRPTAMPQAGLAPLFQKRRERMEGLLEKSYLRVSDPLLTKAMAWLKLSIDACVVEGPRTMMVGRWPWDGSFSGRDNLRSLAGGALVTGEFTLAAGLLETWAGVMDRRAGSATYGRIPGRIGTAGTNYDAIDASGWFTRALYDYVIASGDTARGRSLFPAVREGIAGIRKHNLGTDTLIHHGAGETWTGPERFAGSPPPYTAVEVQSLWQTQQTIASIIAQNLRDTASARGFAQGSVDAGVRFTNVFVDTARRILYDHLDRSGIPHDGLTANGILSTESLDGELMISALVKRSIPGLLTPFGPAEREGGNVVTWLTGPFVYVLSRSDRQDVGAVVTANLAEYSQNRGMAGTLPDGFAATPDGFRADPPGASLPAMAEFVRLVYQDYLGIRIDVPSAVVRFEPKLPPGIDSADVTAYVGTTPLRALYVRGKETSRMTIELGDAPRPVKWRFIWLFENGDGWMGAARVQPGGKLTAVFGPEEMVLFAGEEEVTPEERWFIRGLSQRKEFEGLRFSGSVR